MTRNLLLALAILLPATAASADELPGRYTIERVEDGFLRLDSVTGSLSLCAAKNEVWSCATVKDDSAALRAENEKLKARIAELEAASKSLSLPSDQDVSRLMDMFGTMVDRLIGMTRKLDSDETAI